MQYIKFKERFKSLPFFSISDIRKVDKDFHNVRLSDWQKKGYIQKIKRSFYIFSDEPKNEKLFFNIANSIYTPSYISLESALSYYGLIPEGVYTITSVSTRKTYTCKSKLAVFSYRHILPSLNWGYEVVESENSKIKIASIEKALLDYLYLNRNIVEGGNFYEWRFNSREFLEKADLIKLENFANNFNKEWFKKDYEKLLKLIQNS